MVREMMFFFGVVNLQRYPEKEIDHSWVVIGGTLYSVLYKMIGQEPSLIFSAM